MQTAQEVFDFVANHLHEQGRPARDTIGLCRYRTKDGLKCAVGCLIPDDEYDPTMEHRGIHTLISYSYHNLPEQTRKMFVTHLKLLRDLQFMHDSIHLYDDNDGSFNLVRLDKDLKDIANQHSLKYSPKIKD